MCHCPCPVFVPCVFRRQWNRFSAPRRRVLVHNYHISLILLMVRLSNEHTVGFKFFPYSLYCPVVTCCRNTPKFLRIAIYLHSNLTGIWPTSWVFGFPFLNFSVTQHFHQFWFGVRRIYEFAYYVLSGIIVFIFRRNGHVFVTHSIIE